MMEHRLIERALADAPIQLASRAESDGIPPYVDVLTDFLHFYADRTHHGKEEQILFRQLAGKSPAAEIAQLMEELLADHAHSRVLVGRLVDANERLRIGDRAALSEKEDRHFFKPSMAYFSPEERRVMLREFSDLDRTMIHEKYREVVDGLEGGGEAGNTLA
jgi:hypothetical protein